MSVLFDTARHWAREEPAPAFAGHLCSLLPAPQPRFPAVERVRMGLMPPNRPAVMQLLLAAVASAFDVTPARLVGPDQTGGIRHPRLALYWLAYQHIGWTTHVVGELLARDHSTISVQVRKARRLRGSDPQFRLLTDALAADVARELAEAAKGGTHAR